MKIAGIVHDSIVDGPGIRCTVFFQGCTHNCLGCQNPQTHDFNAGQDMSVDNIIEEITKNKLISGVTISGGEPLDQLFDCLVLVQTLKYRHYNIWLYTGYTFEELLDKMIESVMLQQILHYIDVLVDGPYIKSQRSWELNYKGSKNQRIIDIKKTFESGHIVEVNFKEDELDKFKIPKS